MADNAYVPVEFLLHMEQLGLEDRGEICGGASDEILDPIGVFLGKARNEHDFVAGADGWDEEIGTGVVAKAPERDFMSTQESYELRKRITRCVDKTIDGIRWRYCYDGAGELVRVEDAPVE